jgi:hypothetical protein
VQIKGVTRQLAETCDRAGFIDCCLVSRRKEQLVRLFTGSRVGSKKCFNEATGAEERAPISSSWKGLKSVITSESVITSMAGFEVAFPLVERALSN